MRSLLTLGLISFALTFCGLSEKLKQVSGTNGSSNTATSPANSASNSSSAPAAGKPELTGAQKTILDSAQEVKWDDQGLSWKLPPGWSKMQVAKETFNYKSGDNAFLLVNISVMPDSFPMDASLNAYYEQAMQQLKNGKYESAKMVEIDVPALSSPRRRRPARTTSADISGSDTVRISGRSSRST